jgi:deoxyribose-phosphate aldolase
MSEEVSIVALVRAIKPVVRDVVREELERCDKRVAKELLKIVLADMGAKKGTGEKRVMTAGKG